MLKETQSNPIIISFGLFYIIHFNVIVALSNGKQKKPLQLGIYEKEPYDISFTHHSYTGYCNWYCLSCSWYIDLSPINTRKNPCKNYLL